MDTFGAEMFADVTKAEMQASESDSKFVSGFFNRITYTIENSLKE